MEIRYRISFTLQNLINLKFILYGKKYSKVDTVSLYWQSTLFIVIATAYVYNNFIPWRFLSTTWHALWLFNLLVWFNIIGFHPDNISGFTVIDDITVISRTGIKKNRECNKEPLSLVCSTGTRFAFNKIVRDVMLYENYFLLLL